MKRFDDNTATASTDNKVIPISRSKGIDKEALRSHVKAMGASFMEPYTELKPVGNGEYQGLCTFHTEKTPSLNFNPEDGVFKCFGCDAKGDVFEFYRRIKGLRENDFEGVLKGLARDTGFNQSASTPSSKPVNRPLQAKGKKVVRIPGFLGNTTIEQAKALYDVPLGEDTFKQCIEPYFLSRDIHITLEDARRFHIQADKEKHVLYCPKVDQDGMTVRTWWRPVTPDFLKKEGKEGKAKDFTHNSENTPYGVFVIPGEEGELPRVVMFEGIEDALTYYYHQGKANGETIVAIGGKENWLKAYGHCKDSVSVTLYLDGDKGIGSDNKEEYPCMTERGVQEASKLVRALKADREISVKMYLPARAKWDINQAAREDKVQEWLDKRIEINPADIPQEEEKPSIDRGQVEIAQQWVRLHKHLYRYDYELNTWFYRPDRNSHWKEDGRSDGYHWRCSVQEYCTKLSGTKGIKKTLAKIYQSASFIASVQKAVSQDKAGGITFTEWDSNLSLLGAPGKTIDLDRGIVRDIQDDDMITMQVGVVPKEPEPGLRLNYYGLLDGATNNDKDYRQLLQRVAGYAMAATVKERKLFIVSGVSGSGKSTLLEAWNKAMGDYAIVSQTHLLLQNTNAFKKTLEDVPEPGLIALRRKRMSYIDETTIAQELDAGRVKALSANEKITARQLREKKITFDNHCTHFIVTNREPGGELDAAMKHRLVRLPFEVPFCGTEKDNPDIKSDLEKELPYILWWMIQGYGEWKRQRLNIDACDVVKKATEAYLQTHDIKQEWVRTKLKIHPPSNQPIDVGTKQVDLVQSLANFIKENPNTLSKHFYTMVKEFQNEGVIPKHVKRNDSRFKGGNKCLWFSNVTIIEDEEELITPSVEDEKEPTPWIAY